jgi:hypothetical protein
MLQNRESWESTRLPSTNAKTKPITPNEERSKAEVPKEEVHDIGSTSHELFLDGFCLTDKRGRKKESDLRYASTQTDLQNLLTSTKLTLTQRAMCNDDGEPMKTIPYYADKFIRTRWPDLPYRHQCSSSGRHKDSGQICEQGKDRW